MRFDSSGFWARCAPRPRSPRRAATPSSAAAVPRCPGPVPQPDQGARRGGRPVRRPPAMSEHINDSKSHAEREDPASMTFEQARVQARRLIGIFDPNPYAALMERPRHAPQKVRLVEPDGLEKLVADHLLGVRRVGVYPLRGNKLRWVAADLDDHGGGRDLGAECPRAAERLATELRELVGSEPGIFIERTKSGVGRRVSLIFKEPTSARLARHPMREAMRRAGLPKKTELLPKQDDASLVHEGLGSATWLPFFGKD